jgi:thymidylate synthase
MPKRKSPEPTTTHQEYAYLDIMQDILDTGVESDDRTGTGTIKLFSQYMKFNIAHEFPLLTTKKMGLKTIFTELKWFLTGNNNVTWLQDRKCRIWDGNSSDPKYLKISGNKKFNAGKNYSWQLRNFNGSGPSTGNRRDGTDQLAYVIDLLQNNPTSRRILFSYWNPQHIGLKDTCLPPCHLMYIFNVNPKTNELNCAMTQRSADVFLGVPFNIASLAMLVHILCKVTGYTPGKISITMVDTHLYKNHIDQAGKQLTNEPMEWPQLEITKPYDCQSNNVSNALEYIESLEYSDFKLTGYKSHKRIKAPMAV